MANELTLDMFTQDLQKNFQTEAGQVTAAHKAAAPVIESSYAKVKQSANDLAKTATAIEDANAPHFADLESAVATRNELGKTNELVRGIMSLFDPKQGTDYWDGIIQNKTQTIELNNSKLRTHALAQQSVQAAAMTDIEVANSKIAQEQADVDLVKDQMGLASVAQNMMHNKALFPLQETALKLSNATAKIQQDVLKTAYQDELNKRKVDEAVFSNNPAQLHDLEAKVISGDMPGMTLDHINAGRQRKLARESAILTLQSKIFGGKLKLRDAQEMQYLTNAPWKELQSIAKVLSADPNKMEIKIEVSGKAFTLHRGNVLNAYTGASKNITEAVSKRYAVHNRELFNKQSVSSATQLAERIGRAVNGQAYTDAVTSDGQTIKQLNVKPEIVQAISMSKSQHTAIEASGLTPDLKELQHDAVRKSLATTMDAYQKAEIKRLEKDNSPQAQAQYALLNGSLPTQENLTNIQADNVLNPNSAQFNNPIIASLNTKFAEEFLPSFIEQQGKSSLMGSDMFTTNAQGQRIINQSAAQIRNRTEGIADFMTAPSDIKGLNNRDKYRNLYVSTRASTALLTAMQGRLDALRKSGNPQADAKASAIQNEFMADAGNGSVAIAPKYRTGMQFDASKFFPAYEQFASGQELLQSYTGSLMGLIKQDQSSMNINEMAFTSTVLGNPSSFDTIINGTAQQFGAHIPTNKAVINAEAQRLAADPKTLENLNLLYPNALAAIFTAMFLDPEMRALAQGTKQ